VQLCQDTVAQEQGVRPGIESLPAILQKWIAQDRKHTGLKGLQGMIWEEGYRKGEFAPALYEDVFDALLLWRANGVQLALYSSGSEQAQRLLLTHLTTGDLSGFFEHFFDTGIGPKTEADSYRLIAERLGLAPESILFLSDMEAELDAASAAGFKTTQIIRPGTRAGARHPAASSFQDIRLGKVNSTGASHNPIQAA
jgi:enolase-phosphatase E1